MDQREVDIREVWAVNLEEEMAIIREVIDNYCYIAMVSLMVAVTQ